MFCRFLVLGYLCCYLLVSVFVTMFFFLMIRRPPRSTLDRSSAASDVYKRQGLDYVGLMAVGAGIGFLGFLVEKGRRATITAPTPVSYTHLRAHETVLDLVCRLLLEKKKTTQIQFYTTTHYWN